MQTDRQTERQTYILARAHLVGQQGLDVSAELLETGVCGVVRSCDACSNVTQADVTKGAEQKASHRSQIHCVSVMIDDTLDRSIGARVGDRRE